MQIPKQNFGNLSAEVLSEIAENMRVEQNKRKFVADQIAFELGKKPRKKPSHKEDDLQKALTKWLDYQANLLKFVWYAIPNGGRRDAKTGALLKAMGVKAGIPDICICRACNGFNGLYVELKTAHGRLSDEQKIKIGNLRHDGYCVLVVHGLDEAITEISEYLNLC